MDAPGHVAVEGAAVTARGGEPGAAWTLVDWRSRPTGVGGVFGEDGAAVLPPLPCGYYRMVAESGGAGGSPAECEVLQDASVPNRGRAARAPTTLATLAVVTQPSLVTRHSSLVTNEPAQAGSFYGVDSALSWVSRPGTFICPWNDGDTFRTVSDLIALTGLPHVRERLSWSGVNPEHGVFDYGQYLRNADLLHERGILISGMFHDAPKWAGRIRKLPSDLNAVYDFCAATAAAFGDRMGDWEFWNEEDIGFAPEPVWDYAAALKAAYFGFKAGRSGCIVLPGALCQMPDSGYARGLFDNDAGKFGDVYNHHVYYALADYPKHFAALRGFMERYGIGDKAIWITESGTHLEGSSQNDGAMKGFKANTPDQELVVAEYYAKSQVAFQMEGVARNYYFVFGAYSEMRGVKDWGVMRRDGTVKPSYAAISTMTHELVSARLVGEMAVDKELRAYLFEQPDGSQTVVYWSVSPMDIGGGHVVATPDYARKLNLPVANGTYRLSDLCGIRSAATVTNGVLALESTRFPAYVAGLHGLSVKSPARPKGKVLPYVPKADEDMAVILRVDLNTNDFTVAGQKTRAVLKSDTGRMRVQVWNMGDTAKTGRVEVVGGTFKHLPDKIVIGPRGTPPVSFDCMFVPTVSGEIEQHLVFTGLFNGKRSSRLTMPVYLEKQFLDSCTSTPIDWRDPKNWERNTSAHSYSAIWDEAEQAMRFDVAWNDTQTDRWFYPVYRLKLPQESLVGAQLLQFEVKSAQDKVENDFWTQNLMLLFKDKAKTDRHIPYHAPIGVWETRYAELADVDDLADVTAFRLGANPRGTQCTFWIRNLEILRRK